MILATICENTSIDTIFNKNLPKETRGILNGAYSFSGQLGVFVFSILSGYLFDEVGPKTPFYLIGILDFIYAILVIILTTQGLFDVHDLKELKSEEKRVLSRGAVTPQNAYP